MFTENWPGWFQNWGHPVPHRPATDVAFSVARWFAKGGSYMNYYMLFGGTTFGRQVGGPLIITSYDYDVQVNEYGMRAEPKFSLTTKLHQILTDNSDVMLNDASLPLPQAVAFNNSCETHLYASTTVNKCLMFISNYGSLNECTYGTFRIPTWSVTLAQGTVGADNSCSGLVELLNTKSSIYSDNSIPAANYQAPEPLPTVFTVGDSWKEPSPFESAKNAVEDIRQRVSAEVPLEQLSLTKDKTDYLWYTVNIPRKAIDSYGGSITFNVGSAGGGVVYAYINGELVGSSLSSDGQPPVAAKLVSIAVPSIPSSCLKHGSVCQLDLLSVNMGIQNYGPFLEKITTGN